MPACDGKRGKDKGSLPSEYDGIADPVLTIRWNGRIRSGASSGYSRPRPRSEHGTYADVRRSAEGGGYYIYPDQPVAPRLRNRVRYSSWGTSVTGFGLRRVSATPARTRAIPASAVTVALSLRISTASTMATTGR